MCFCGLSYGLNSASTSHALRCRLLHLLLQLQVLLCVLLLLHARILLLLLWSTVALLCAVLYCAPRGKGVLHLCVELFTTQQQHLLQTQQDVTECRPAGPTARLQHEGRKFKVGPPNPQALWRGQTVLVAQVHHFD